MGADNHLDPIDPAGALLQNTTNPGMTNLEYYRNRFGYSRVTNFVSPEVSIYNHPFAISQEVSVYNFPNTTGVTREAISAEVSVRNTP